MHGIERHAYGQRTRRLSDSEYAALGAALRSMPVATWPIAIAAAKFLAITGWRRGEMLALKWVEVDLVTRTAHLVDTKTGASLRPLPHAACDVLRELPHLSELVFPASTGEAKPMRGFHKIWLRIAGRAELPSDVTPHVLRHSLASIAADLGFSELTIAALLGHRTATVTSKYAHHADAVLLQAADAIADRVAALMADAAALKDRATRRLGEIMDAQRKTVGLAKAGRPSKIGFPDNPIITLAEIGIDKNLAHQARKFAAMPADKPGMHRPASPRPFDARADARDD